MLRLTIQRSLTPAFNSKRKYKKISRRCSRFPNYAEYIIFHIPVVLKTAKKSMNTYNARAQPLFYSLDRLLGDVLVAVAVVVCLSSLFPRFASFACICFKLWLVICVLCDWPDWLHWFWFYATSHFRVAFCLCVKTSLCAKLLIRKYFPPFGSFSYKSNFHKKGFARGLVLKQRHCLILKGLSRIDRVRCVNILTWLRGFGVVFFVSKSLL